MASIDRESSGVVSLVLEPADDRPLTVPLAGQFVVLRLRPQVDAPPVLRSYSLSGLPDAGRYRISVKVMSRCAGPAGLEFATGASLG